MIARVSRELGRPCRLHEDCRLEPRYTNSRMIRGPRPGRRGRTQDEPRYRQAKETKCGEKAGKEVAVPHSSVEAGERPFRTPWSEGGAALWTGSWNHAEDTVPHQRVTAKRPSRVRDSDIPQRDEPGAFDVHARICGGPGWVTTQVDPAKEPSGVKSLTTLSVGGSSIE